MTTWAHPVLDARLRELDETSQDIRALEHYLRDASVGWFAGVRLPDGSQLTWAAVKPGGWRVWYIPRNEGSARPLIETPGETRLRCREHLPALVLAIVSIVEAA